MQRLWLRFLVHNTMPDASKDSEFFLEPNSSYASPFSDRPPLVFYSSITIPRSKPAWLCLKCGISDMTREELADFLLAIAVTDEQTQFRSPYFDAGGAEFSTDLPEIPPLPEF